MRDEQHRGNCCVLQGPKEQPCKAVLMDARSCPELLQLGERGHAPSVVPLVNRGVNGREAVSI